MSVNPRVAVKTTTLTRDPQTSQIVHSHKTEVTKTLEK